LVFGIFPPSEAGAFGVAYAVILSMVVYRSMTFADLRNALVEATVLTGEVLLVVGFSVALGWALSAARVPVALLEMMQYLFPFESTIRQIFLMLGLALIAGMVLDPLIPMIMPVLLPSLLALDVDLVHFGVLMVVTVVIGQVTPPVALALIVSARIGQEDIVATFKANTPLLLSMFVLLLLLVFFPALTETHRARVKTSLGPLVAVANPLDYNTFIWNDEPAMTKAFGAFVSGGFDLNMLVLDFPRTDRCSDADWWTAVSAFEAALKANDARGAIVASML